MVQILELMKRLTQKVSEHSFLIENISKKNDISFIHVDKGEKEVKKKLKKIQNNRRLLMRIFLIIICVSIFYIIFMA